MSMDFSRLLEMLLVTMPCVVVLPVCIGVGVCLCHISSSGWRSGIASLQLIKIYLSSASVSDDVISLMILDIVNTDPLLVGDALLFEMKNCPPAVLLDFVSDRYEASL